MTKRDANGFTKAQVRAINKGYSAIIEFAERADWTMAGRIGDAFKYESSRRGATVAKALLIDKFFTGMAQHEQSKAWELHTLYSLSQGLATALLCGAEAARKGMASADFYPHQVAQLDAMQDAREERRSRRDASFAS